MNNKKLTILIAVLVIILVVILFAFLSNKKSPLKSVNTEVQPNTVSSETGAATSSPQTNEASLEGVDISTIEPVVPAALGELPGSSEAPKQAVVETSNIPVNAVKLSVSDTGFSPKEFTVSAGEKVSLAITSTSNGAHVFIFPNASLMGLTMMVLGGETKLIEFTAPAAGSYAFRDDIPSYRGNTGTMIVK